MEAKFTKRFKGIINTMHFTKIAAMPDVASDNFPIGYGMQKLICSWIEEVQEPEFEKFELGIDQLGASQFNQFYPKLFRREAYE